MKRKEFRRLSRRIDRATYDEKCRYFQQWAIRNLRLMLKRGGEGRHGE